MDFVTLLKQTEEKTTMAHTVEANNKKENLPRNKFQKEKTKYSTFSFLH
jgi:hypothetical protein